MAVIVAEHQWSSSCSSEVLQETLGVVDGGVQLGIGALPLSVQILPTQRTTMISIDDAIRVEHGDDFEDIAPS